MKLEYINDLPKLRLLLKHYYISYVNEFYSIQGFADFYSMTYVEALNVIRKGGKYYKEDHG